MCYEMVSGGLLMRTKCAKQVVCHMWEDGGRRHLPLFLSEKTRLLFLRVTVAITVTVNVRLLLTGFVQYIADTTVVVYHS